MKVSEKFKRVWELRHNRKKEQNGTQTELKEKRKSISEPFVKIGDKGDEVELQLIKKVDGNGATSLKALDIPKAETKDEVVYSASFEDDGKKDLVKVKKTEKVDLKVEGVELQSISVTKLNEAKENRQRRLTNELQSTLVQPQILEPLDRKKGQKVSKKKAMPKRALSPSQINLANRKQEDRKQKKDFSFSFLNISQLHISHGKGGTNITNTPVPDTQKPKSESDLSVVPSSKSIKSLKINSLASLKDIRSKLTSSTTSPSIKSPVAPLTGELTIEKSENEVIPSISESNHVPPNSVDFSTPSVTKEADTIQLIEVVKIKSSALANEITDIEPPILDSVELILAEDSHSIRKDSSSDKVIQDSVVIDILKSSDISSRVIQNVDEQIHELNEGHTFTEQSEAVVVVDVSIEQSIEQAK